MHSSTTHLINRCSTFTQSLSGAQVLSSCARRWHKCNNQNEVNSRATRSDMHGTLGGYPNGCTRVCLLHVRIDDVSIHARTQVCIGCAERENRPHHLIRVTAAVEGMRTTFGSMFGWCYHVLPSSESFLTHLNVITVVFWAPAGSVALGGSVVLFFITSIGTSTRQECDAFGHR